MQRPTRRDFLIAAGAGVLASFATTKITVKPRKQAEILCLPHEHLICKPEFQTHGFPHASDPYFYRLIQSIEEQGILMPLKVMEGHRWYPYTCGDEPIQYYNVICGYRRLWAVRALAARGVVVDVPCEVMTVTMQEAIEHRRLDPETRSVRLTAREWKAICEQKARRGSDALTY